MQLLQVFRDGPVPYLINFIWIGFYTIAGQYVTKKQNFCLKETTLGRLNFQVEAL